MVQFELDAGKTFSRLLCFIAVLLLLNFATILSRFYFGFDFALGLVPLFDFGAEKNIPTLYSSLALLVSSTLLFLIALSHRRNGASYRYWFGLAFIFLFLSIDETATLHERLIKPVRALLNTSGLLYFAWVIPYGAVLIVFILTYSRFLMRLPAKTRILFCIAGTTFVTGAIGFELLGGRHYEIHGKSNTAYALFQTAEEFLEMLGVVIFIYSLLNYIVNQFGSLTLTLNKQK